MAAPFGNKNNAKGKVWGDALRKAIVQDDHKRIRLGIEKLLDAHAAGEPWAIKEIADRLDGKAAQSVEVTGDPENPLEVRNTHNMAVDAITLLDKVRGTD